MPIRPSLAPISTTGDALWNGDIAELYFHTPATWFDITNPRQPREIHQRRCARSTWARTAPTSLGVQPLVCFNGATTAGWTPTLVQGGAFTLNGALTDGAVPLPTAAAGGMVFPPPLRRFQHMLVR